MNIKNTIFYWYLMRKRRKANIRKDGYSQYGQDIAVYELLGKQNNGFFLDIGANDGITFSNSLLFEKVGWQGVCVEPHPEIYERLKKNRNCHLVNACIADNDRMVNFLVVDGPSHMLSGIEEYLDERHLKRIDNELRQYGGTKKVIGIEALSPFTVLQRFSVKTIDYLSVDTEGCELAILKSFDLSQLFIKVIGVENGNRSPNLFRYLTSFGYRLVKCIGCDEIYMRR